MATISKNAETTLEKIKMLTNMSSDITSHKFLIGQKIPACVVFVDNMSNKDHISDFVIKPLQLAQHVPSKLPIEVILNSLTSFPDTKVVDTLENCVLSILSGNCILIVEGLKKAIDISAKGYQVRAIQEPPTEVTIKGPREGFVEDMKSNMVMLRRKLRTPNLVFENMVIGEQSETNIAICYMKDIAEPSIIDSVTKKLKAINIDAILDSSYITAFLEENRRSIFKQVGTTEKPDVLAGKLLEGRIGIIVDGSPFALTIPFLLSEDFQQPQDYYEKSTIATAVRILRYFAVSLATLLPALYVSAKMFHSQFFPLKFLLTIMASTKKISLPPSIEMFVVLILFEILKEASTRMPKYVGMALSVASALVLGDTAVKAGIISSPTILVMALSGIALYTIPDMENAFSLLRVIFLILAGSFGIYGILIGVVFLITYLCSLSSYQTPYVAPYSPFILNDIQDTIIKKPLPEMKRRPFSIPHTNTTRIKGNDKKNV